jgi:hypothetical protein
MRIVGTEQTCQSAGCGACGRDPTPSTEICGGGNEKVGSTGGDRLHKKTGIGSVRSPDSASAQPGEQQDGQHHRGAFWWRIVTARSACRWEHRSLRQGQEQNHPRSSSPQLWTSPDPRQVARMVSPSTTPWLRSLLSCRTTSARTTRLRGVGVVSVIRHPRAARVGHFMTPPCNCRPNEGSVRGPNRRPGERILR